MCAWLVDETLARTFRVRSDTVLRAMDGGGYAGSLPQSQTTSRMRFLESAHKRLALGMADPRLDAYVRRWVQAMERKGISSSEIGDERRSMWLGRAGLPDARPGDTVTLAPHHVYARSQGWAANPSCWRNPSAGIAHSAVQLAFAAELEWAGGKDEPALTDALLNTIGTQAAGLVDSINKSPTEVPPGTFFKFYTVNMQTGKDELDSDLALVVGLRVGGRPVYRVCLLQAKWRPSHGGRIGTRKGRQLMGLMGAGMGFYLFYPASSGSSYDDFRFASVVPAGSVFRDVWSRSGRPSYRNVDTLSSPFATAWDFPTFVSAMLDPRTGWSARTFGTVDAAAEALRGDRELPLAPRILAIDTTGDEMLVAKLEGKYDPKQKGTKLILKAPPRPDTDYGPDDTPEAPHGGLGLGRGARRPGR